MTTRKHITIYDIAREAHVSPATVSRILNGSGTVSEEKRLRVQQLIDKYRFHPNAMARALSDAKTRVIGMMLADVGNPYYNSLFSACVATASRPVAVRPESSAPKWNSPIITGRSTFSSFTRSMAEVGSMA